MGSPVTNKKYWELYEPVKEILEYFEYSKEGEKLAQELENKLIQPDFKNPLCLNEHYGRVISSSVISKAAKEKWKCGTYKKFQSEKMKSQWESQNFLESCKRNQRGKGTIWITNGTREGNKKIKKWESIPPGFYRGRVMKTNSDGTPFKKSCTGGKT